MFATFVSAVENGEIGGQVTWTNNPAQIEPHLERLPEVVAIHEDVVDCLEIGGVQPVNLLFSLVNILSQEQ